MKLIKSTKYPFLEMVKPQSQVLKIIFPTNSILHNNFVFKFSSDITFIFSKIGNDLAMLSLADHSILSYGTFGIWGALLRKKDGEVVLPKLRNESFSSDIIKRQWQAKAIKEKASMDSYGYEIPESWIKL